MAMTLPGYLVTALQYLGYEWPSSNEDVLNNNAAAFDDAGAAAAAAIDEIAGAIRHIDGLNDSDASAAFLGYMKGSESNLTSLGDFQDASSTIAGGFRLVAGAVVILKGVVIAQLVILAAAIASAFFTFGLGAAAAVAAREAAKRLINLAINVAIEKVLG